MALQFVSSAAQVPTNVKNTIAVYQPSASSVIYTVPANRYFEGFMIGEGSTTIRFTVNGSAIVYKFNSTNPAPMPLFLKAGDVLATTTTDFYWTVTGVEKELES